MSIFGKNRIVFLVIQQLLITTITGSPTLTTTPTLFISPEPIFTNSTATPTTPTTTTSTTTTTTTSTTTPSPFTTTSGPPTPTTTTSTTTTTTTSTTTPSPFTTTSGPPTPTPRPPVPDKGAWTVEFATINAACIFLEMAASIEFYYINIWNEIDKGQMNIPPQAMSTGNCEEAGRHKQFIRLTWYLNSDFENNLEFVFRRNNHIYELDRVALNVTLDADNFPTARDAGENLILVNKNIHFMTPENRSYKCSKQHTLPLHLPRKGADIGRIKINHLHFQAFGNIINGHLDKVIDCKPSYTSDLLFISTGALTLVVVIVVIYVIIRRKHPFGGYLATTDQDRNHRDSERVKIFFDAKRHAEFPAAMQSKENDATVKIPYNTLKLFIKKFGKK